MRWIFASLAAFMQFELHITPAGVERSISQPQIDMPVERQELQLAPGSRANLDTPIRLRFASRSSAAPASFVSTI